ncbi:hypothetical protein ACIBL3_29965 [Kribbella sp. NPDC050124]|uniref:hypothetical protein n=1 Tax=Kribbella sp. NPDC050124 TaxID=3364114 RepID=UPI003794F43B
MTIASASLQRELEQWEQSLRGVADEDFAVDPRPDQLMATIQATVTAYRSHILPALTACRAGAAPADAVIADEVARIVDRLEEVRRELVAGGHLVGLQLRVYEALAGLRALTRVAVRIGQG